MSKTKQPCGFCTGDIVKSLTRTKDYPLFAMILCDPNPVSSQFNGIVIYDAANEQATGEISNNWNTVNFTLSSWKEASPFLIK